MNVYVEVLIAATTRKTDRPFTYHVSEAMADQAEVGRLCEVPFGRGNRTAQALVVRVFEAEALSFPTKDVHRWLPGVALVNAEGMALARHMVEHDLSDQTAAIQTVLPPGRLGSYRPLLRSFYHLTPEGRSAQVPQRATKQRAALEALRDGELSRKELFARSMATADTLRRLEEKGWVERTERRVERRAFHPQAHDPAKVLTAEQREVYERIVAQTGTYLICGVTGSGKTEIYLQLVARALEEGKEAIVLVPEISLTPQTIQRFAGRFGDQIAILHSRLSPEERYEEWERIQNGEVTIAIGARSAIFAPFEHLGVIIIDEEHETSYASEKNPRYHAREIAQFRARWHDCSLVLASATPSVDSLYAAKQGEIMRLDLLHRVHDRPLPKTELVDMREELKANNRSMFSRPLRMAIDHALRRGEQAILFLNRRGHTSYVFCRQCGYVYRCDACDVAMTYHKHREKLICHYCGREKKIMNTCPQCGSSAIREFGAGTEQLEEATRALFPAARIARADADTMRRKDAYQEIYEGMRDGRIDILIGTQMIAKGFDFPKVTVVGVMAADVSLNQPDLHAGERTFQLITQVAGRAGRDQRAGHVYIQTYKPMHPVLQAAAAQNVDAFYDGEMAFRRENGYPPVRHEMQIVLSGPKREAVLTRALAIRKAIEAYEERNRLFVDGPTPCLIERMNLRYRFQLVVRGKERLTLERLGQKLIDAFPTSPEIWVIVSLDPMTMN
ncbi:MAG: primosomal protein N' [Peptoniphilaceae bacterium]|nr:primosomal protein N' [Peptoniphilaceae bacterium]MDY6085594.1 primosomal protein N' [Peptoniphilaceae bacterium]